MQKVFSNAELKLNQMVIQNLEWSIKNNELYSCFTLVRCKGKKLITLKNKIFNFNEDQMLFRPFKNLKCTSFISDFLYYEENIDEIKSIKKDDYFIIKAYREGKLIKKVKNKNEATAICKLFLLINDEDEKEIDKLIEEMEKFNTVWKERTEAYKQLKNKK